MERYSSIAMTIIFGNFIKQPGEGEDGPLKCTHRLIKPPNQRMLVATACRRQQSMF